MRASTGLLSFAEHLHEDDPEAWGALVDRMHEYFVTRPGGWEEFLADASLDSGRDIARENVEAGLQATLLDREWITGWNGSREGPDRRAREERLAGLGWLSDAEGMPRALRDPAVAEFQVRDWVRSVVKDGEAAAERLGVTTLGGIATLAALDSTGLDSLVSDLSGPEGSRILEAGGARWHWDEPPPSVPLEEWRALVLWQYYWARRAEGGQESMRGRMGEIWDEFYAPAWRGNGSEGRPADWREIPEYRGAAMESGTFTATELPGAGPTRDATAPPNLPAPPDDT